MALSSDRRDDQLVYVCPDSELAEGGRQIVDVGVGRRAGVFRVNGELLAFENACAHQGGPVCEGRILPAVDAQVDDRGQVVSEASDHHRPHLVCPWHGWEYALPAGRAVGRPDLGLRRFPVEVRDECIYVVADSGPTGNGQDPR